MQSVCLLLISPVKLAKSRIEGQMNCSIDRYVTCESQPPFSPRCLLLLFSALTANSTGRGSRRPFVRPCFGIAVSPDLVRPAEEGTDAHVDRRTNGQRRVDLRLQ